MIHNRSQGCEVDCHENLTTCTGHVAYSVCLFKGWDIHVFDISSPKHFAPEDRPKAKRKVVFQPSNFRCYLNFREGT